MTTEITHPNQETGINSAYLAVRLYDRSRVIIRRKQVVNRNSKISLPEQKKIPKNISKQVREQKDKVISNALLLFGTIH